jgi:hypothetical protein
MKIRNQLLLIALLFLAMILPMDSFAQTTNVTTMPPKAQAAMKKGLDAAKLQEWTVAIRYFNEAHQSAPDSPVPLVNLGLAESQLPGHELRAVCWFEAYLILVPAAVNAPAVRQQISNLETRVKGNTDKIIEMLKVLAGQASINDSSAYANIAGLLAASGDLDAAEQIVANQSDKNIQGNARLEIVQALVNSKRIPDAIKEAGQIPDSYKEYAYESITSAQIAAGLFSDAKKSIVHLSEGAQEAAHWDNAYELAEAAYQAGQHEDAAAMLRDIRTAFTTIDNTLSWMGEEYKEYAYDLDLAPFAAAEYKMGMHEEADTIFKQIKEFAYNTKGSVYGNKGRTPYGDRTQLLRILAISEDQIGRRSIALQLMNEAKSACLAGQSAHEASGIIPNETWVLGGYQILKDWDGAKSWINQNRGNVDFDYKYEKDELANWEANDLYTSAKAASIKILADSSSSPARRAQAWSDYIKGCLSAPLFTTDFKATMSGLANFTPSANDAAKSETVFDHVKQPAADLIDRLNDISQMECDALVNRLKDVRELQAKQINSADQKP